MGKSKQSTDKASPVLLSLAAPGSGHLALGYRRLGWLLLGYFIAQFAIIMLGFLAIFVAELADVQQLAFEKELATGQAVSTFSDITIPAMTATFVEHPIFWIAMLVQFLGITIFATVDAARRGPALGEDA